MTWTTNADMHMWWRMITEVEHDDHAPETCDSWHGLIMPRAWDGIRRRSFFAV